MLRVILTVLAATSASTAVAANWHFVSAAPDNSSLVYIDTDTLDTEGSLKTVWMKQDNAVPDEAGVTRVLSRAAYDCDARTYNLLAYVIYGADGGIMDRGEVPADRQSPEALVAGSEGEKTLTYLCGTGHRI